MKLTFRQTGGFAALEKGIETDEHQLPALLQKAFAHLLSMPWANAKGDSSSTDLIKYEITVHDGKKQQCWSFDDMNLPPELADLIEYLTAHSKPVPLK